MEICGIRVISLWVIDDVSEMSCLGRQSVEFEAIGKPNPDVSYFLVGNSRTCCSLLLAKVRIPNVKGVHTTQLDSQSDVFALFIG